MSVIGSGGRAIVMNMIVVEAGDLCAEAYNNYLRAIGFGQLVDGHDDRYWLAEHLRLTAANGGDGR